MGPKPQAVAQPGPGRRLPGIRLSYGQKIFLLAAIPLVFAAAAIAVLVSYQSRQLAQQEIAALERQLINAKREELKNYMSLARTAIINTYGRALPDDEAAKLQVTQTLSALLYGQDGYFYVYDYDGNSIVSPRMTSLIGRNWTGLADSQGTPVVDRLIAAARSGGGYNTYLWKRPSTGEEAQMISYTIGFQDWRWAVGTGIFIDDILSEVAAARAKTEARVQRTFLWIVAITTLALLMVFLSGLVLNLRERRLADAKLKELAQRVIDTQEEERHRVARELHDSISQILVSVRYAIELAARSLERGGKGAQGQIAKGKDGLTLAIKEVRRISRDLRPGVLDDLGLGPALRSMVEEFSRRTGITTEFDTAVFRNRLDRDAKVALYRIAQEALTNIERHADATHVSIKAYGHRKGATLRIQDNGKGIPHDDQAQGGLGLRNMTERVEQLDGSLRILSSRSGTVIEATVPLTHMLPPETHLRDSA